MEVIKYASGNRQMGWICGHGGQSRRRKKCSCGEPSDWLCDAPGEKKGRTCDKPICSDCAVQIRCHDIDICPEHASGRREVSEAIDLNDCHVRNETRVRCEGVFLGAPHNLCVHHAVFFDEWLAFHGGEDVYLSEKTRTAKRAVFRTWLDELPQDETDGLMAKRHLR